MKDFSFKTIDNFDEHINASVPNYEHIHELILSLSTYYIKENARVIDLGCSTGLLLHKLNEFHKLPSVSYIGYDTEPNLTNQGYSKDNIVLKNEDITKIDDLTSNLTLSIFTLQFLPKEARLPLLRKIKEGLNGAFIITEKTYEETGITQDLFTFAYYDYKAKSFSSKEILDKQRTLRKIMLPLTIKENEDLLREAGFKNISRFYQSLNFVGWICT